MERPPKQLEKLRVPQMRRSKLEIYVDILKVLANNGPMMHTNLMAKANFNSTMLKEQLSFLVKNDLVEERTVKKRNSFFAVTKHGISVLKYFNELEQVPPIIE
jgi:predicted transcriptional regulator